MKKSILIKELTKLLVYYPQHKRSVDEISILSEMWLEDLSDISDDDFHQAIIKYRITHEFFPVPKDIRDCCKQMCRDLKDGQNTKMLPFPDMTKEEIEENKKFIRNLRVLKGV